MKRFKSFAGIFVKTEFTSSIWRWYRALKDRDLRRRLERAFALLESAGDIRDLRGIVRVKEERGRAYRVRIGKIRILFLLEADTLVIYRIESRNEVYR